VKWTHNLFIFRKHFYFAYGVGSSNLCSYATALRHKKKAFSRPIKSAESLYFTLVDMISGMEVKEDDDDFMNAVPARYGQTSNCDVSE
jgi:hypothetical protein